MVKSFSDYITEAKQEITITFGRLNPPTVGHQKLLDAVARTAAGGPYHVYVSQSQDSKKNPLEYTQKVKYIRKMFPRHARSVILDKSIRSIFDVFTKLYQDGYTQVNMVVGSDRVSEFEKLGNKYNGVEGRHGFYNFEGGINVISAGERDADSEGVSGMSASKLRQAAADNDFQLFMKGMPSDFDEARNLFNDVRKGMGLTESTNFRKHIQLNPVSEEREAYVSGNLFSEGSSVVINATEEVGTVQYLGANYVIVETGEGKRYRKWVTDVTRLDEGENVDRVKQEYEDEKQELEDRYADELADAERRDEIDAEQEQRRQEDDDADDGSEEEEEPVDESVSSKNRIRSFRDFRSK